MQPDAPKLGVELSPRCVEILLIGQPLPRLKHSTLLIQTKSKELRQRTVQKNNSSGRIHKKRAHMAGRVPSSPAAAVAAGFTIGVSSVS